MSLIKNKNTKKTIMLFILLCVVILLVYEIAHIFAVFQSEVTGDVEFKNGTWSIKVNGTDISNTGGTKKTFTIDQITVGENSHVKSGNLAPGLSGSFEIAIVPTNTNVSVKYDITLDKKNLTNSYLKIKSIEEIQDNNELIQTDADTYTAIIPLEKIQNNITNKIKVEVEWEDVEENSDEDTKLGQSSDKLQIPITVHVCQYLGETITPYTGE